jgi:hypothetical protein
MKTFLVLLFCIASNFVVSQQITSQVISSAGTDFNSIDYKLSFTIGEPLTGLRTSNEIMILEGFQSFIEPPKAIVTSNNQLTQEELLVYPNPTTQFINVKLNSNELSQLTIVSTHGEIYRDLPLQKISTLPVGLYLLQIDTYTAHYTQKIFKQ